MLGSKTGKEYIFLVRKKKEGILDSGFDFKR